MAKRTIQECDLTKQEFDPEKAVIITLKTKDKKGRSYELCPDAAELLERALVSREAHTIISGTQASTKTLGDTFDIDENDRLVAEKEAGREAEPVTIGINPDSIELTKKGGSCTHMNKTRPQVRTIDGKKGFWQQCKDCGSSIKCRTTAEKAEKIAVPNGVRLTTHPSEDRDR